MLDRKTKIEKTILVGIRHPYQSSWDASESLYELERLVHTAGAKVVATTQQEVKHIDPATYIGKGKIEEIAQMVQEYQVETVVFDEDLSPGQNRRLEEGIKCKVVDRSGLILDILVKEGQEVSEEDQLVILEAMKMENIITSPRNGVIKKIGVSQGDAVEKKQLLIEFQ